MEQAFTIFHEALWNASIIPFSHEATLAAMAGFGGFDLTIPTLFAIAGGTLGQMLNLMIGMFVLRFYIAGKLHVSEYWYNKCAQLFNKYGVWLLIFSWVSILKILVVFAGFLGTRPRFALPLILIGQVYHYSNYLM
jgi:membrane protein YqaA with SNARE-associated domain